jgi:hypothetical protein
LQDRTHTWPVRSHEGTDRHVPRNQCLRRESPFTVLSLHCYRSRWLRSLISGFIVSCITQLKCHWQAKIVPDNFPPPGHDRLTVSMSMQSFLAFPFVIYQSTLPLSHLRMVLANTGGDDISWRLGVCRRWAPLALGTPRKVESETIQSSFRTKQALYKIQLRGRQDTVTGRNCY